MIGIRNSLKVNMVLTPRHLGSVKPVFGLVITSHPRLNSIKISASVKTENHQKNRLGIRHSGASRNRNAFRAASWIPASAGMTLNARPMTSTANTSHFIAFKISRHSIMARPLW